MNNVIISSIEIGKRIREYRKKAGLTQEKLAEMLEVSFQQIQKYENGSSKLNTDKLQMLANALSIPVMYLFPQQATAPLFLSEQEHAMLMAFREIRSSKIKDCFSKIIIEYGK